MKIRDPLSGWKEPVSIRLWGNSVSPPIKDGWMEYIGYYIHPDIASAIGRLLIPSFVEYDGGVFLSKHFTVDGYSRWKRSCSSVEEIERIINHQHVYDIFSENDEISEESYEGIAFLMEKALKITLKAEFPKRAFCVYLSNGDNDYGPTLYFHSVQRV